MHTSTHIPHLHVYTLYLHVYHSPIHDLHTTNLFMCVGIGSSLKQHSHSVMMTTSTGIVESSSLVLQTEAQKGKVGSLTTTSGITPAYPKCI